MNDKLSKAEIRKVVLHILKRRGIAYLEDSVDNNSSKTNHKKEININKQELSNKTPGEIQLERLINTGRVRTGLNQLGEYKLNVFPVSAYAAN